MDRIRISGIEPSSVQSSFKVEKWSPKSTLIGSNQKDYVINPQNYNFYQSKRYESTDDDCVSLLYC